MTSRTLLFVLVLCVPLQAQNLDDILKSLLDGVKNIGGQVQKMGGDIAGLRTDVAGLASRVSGLETTSTTQLHQLRQSVNKTGGDVQKIGGDMTSLQTDVTVLKTDIARMANRVSGLETSSKTQLEEVSQAVKRSATESKALLTQCSTRTDVTMVAGQLRDLQLIAGKSLVELQAASQCCEKNSRQRSMQLAYLQGSLSVIQGLQKQTLTTPSPATTTNPPSTTPTTSSLATTTTPLPVTTTTSSPAPITPKPGIPEDCVDVVARGMTSEGVYFIKPVGSPRIEVYCKDGWTVMQRRFQGDTIFDRPYADYQMGFGLPSGDHWLGLDTLHLLTSKHKCKLNAEFYLDDSSPAHADLYVNYPGDGDGKKKFIEITNFAVGTPQSGYQLSLSGLVTNLLMPWIKTFNRLHDKALFSARDVGPQQTCTKLDNAAWWFTGVCYRANFNANVGTQKCSTDNKICATVAPYYLRRVQLSLKC